MNPVFVVKRPTVAKFSVFNFARFEPFFFTATQNWQTDFTLTYSPVAVILLAINGTVQSKNDFSISGQVITLSDGVDSGDTVYGVVQI